LLFEIESVDADSVKYKVCDSVSWVKNIFARSTPPESILLDVFKFPLISKILFGPESFPLLPNVQLFVPCVVKTISLSVVSKVIAFPFESYA
jgi:hypothetical protein